MTMTQPSGDLAVAHSKALAVRDWALIMTPVLAGVFCLVAAISDPAPGLDDEELAVLYAEHTDALSVHALTLHFGFGLWILLALLVPRLVRDRGAWIANIGGFLGFLGITTLPSLMFTDFIGVGVTKEFGAAGAVAAAEHTEAIWGVPVFLALGLPTAVLAPIVAAAALWRAGVIRWWGFGLVVVAFLGYFVVGPVWQGGVIMLPALAAFSVVLHRALADRSRALGPASG